MKISRVEIKNFRSIELVTLNLNPTCRVLVGINETGKSNILHALALLDPSKAINPNDVRFPLPDEPVIDEAYIQFAMTLDSADRVLLGINLNRKIASKSSPPLLIKDSKVSLTIEKIIESVKEGLYIIDVLKNSRKASHWSIAALTDPGYSVAAIWKKPLKSATTTIKTPKGEVPITNFSIINTLDYPDIPTEVLSTVTKDDLRALFFETITTLVNSRLPKCIHWTYSENYLLPSKIKLTDFSANPEICIPLMNMFELAGIQDIPTAIEKAKERSTGLRNLLERISDRTTKHIREIWKEYKSVDILIEPDGEFINASVRDKTNRFDFSIRSDGFKRFVSFLLIISAKARSKSLENTLLLIDEPEIGLHPAGSRHLRDELIKISDDNQVVYSTHSIFMIDKENIGRHLMVDKKNEITTVLNVTESNFVDEEVIYNALGCSIFDSLNSKNLVFEGWKDKKLFSTALSKPSLKSLKKFFSEIGLAHLQGVKDAPRIVPMLDLANRKYLIVSDDDQPAKEAQKKFSGTGVWKRYSELLPDTDAITGEDFVKITSIQAVLEKLRITHVELPVIEEIPQSGRIDFIKKKLNKAGIPQDKTNQFLEEIKNSIFEALKYSDIEDEYFTFIEKLKIQIEQLN